MRIQTVHDERTGSSEAEIAELRNLFPRYRVCSEVFRQDELVDHKKEQTGFRLELLGTHQSGVEHPEPGCTKCQDVFAALHLIADWIVPKEERPSTCHIEPFERG